MHKSTTIPVSLFISINYFLAKRIKERRRKGVNSKFSLCLFFSLVLLAFLLLIHSIISPHKLFQNNPGPSWNGSLYISLPLHPSAYLSPFFLFLAKRIKERRRKGVNSKFSLCLFFSFNLLALFCHHRKDSRYAGYFVRLINKFN